MSGSRMRRKSPSRAWTVLCSEASALRRALRLGLMRMASQGVKAKAANRENSMAVEPRAGIGSM